MIGYHYTSLSNWNKIQKEGLKPHPCHTEELSLYFDKPPDGIWIWRKELSPQSELGSLIYQLSTKGETKIVKLAIKYDDFDDLLWHPEGLISLAHSGMIGSFSYHDDNPKAYIVVKPIRPKHIKLVKIFDLMELVS